MASTGRRTSSASPDGSHGLGFLPTMTTDIEAVTEAIYDYQLRVFRWPRPDSRVDVENKTHRALKAGRKEGSMAL